MPSTPAAIAWRTSPGYELGSSFPSYTSACHPIAFDRVDGTRRRDLRADRSLPRRDDREVLVLDRGTRRGVDGAVGALERGVRRLGRRGQGGVGLLTARGTAPDGRVDRTRGDADTCQRDHRDQRRSDAWDAHWPLHSPFSTAHRACECTARAIAIQDRRRRRGTRRARAASGARRRDRSRAGTSATPRRPGSRRRAGCRSSRPRLRPRASTPPSVGCPPSRPTPTGRAPA